MLGFHRYPMDFVMSHTEPFEIIKVSVGKVSHISEAEVERRKLPAAQRHHLTSLFDVVAWTGNYASYKYHLTKFVNAGSISVDHINASICFNRQILRSRCSSYQSSHLLCSIGCCRQHLPSSLLSPQRGLRTRGSHL